MNFITYMQLIVFILATIGFVVLGYKLIKKTSSGFEPMEYTEAMDIVDASIQQQFKFKYDLEYKLKDIKMIYDFEKDMTDITKSVLLSFGQQFYQHLDYYHDRDYIYKYVSKQTQILLLEFQNKIKITTK